MRWSGQELGSEESAALPGLARLSNFVRTVRTPEFAGVTFHEVLAKSALNHVPGTSKAMPFGWTINPYRGCSHSCVYCVSPETLVLMGDGRQKPIWQVRVGDEVYGTEVRGRYRRYVKTTVSAAWGTRKRAYRVTLADGTELVASGDHRFLSDRGWKYVTGVMGGRDQRAHLTSNNSLLGFGLNGLTEIQQPAYFSSEYRRGYLTGMIRGDGMIFHHRYPQRRGGGREVHAFRLALADSEALNRSRLYLDQEGIATVTRPFAVATVTRRAITAIHTSRRSMVERIEKLISWPACPTEDWRAGFLAGVFDAEGSCSRGVLRISNKDPEILAAISTSLTGPAITRKLDIEGSAVKSAADLRVVSVEDLGEELDMVDITTGTGDFIANGVISHNCFARKTHEYLDLDSGKDFDSEIIVKVNVAEVLARELRRPSWEHPPVALGTNTDPYQRAEGRYRLMPGIIAALADSGTPFSILTKGTLLRRDLPLLAEAAQHVPVDLAMSIAVYDDELQQSIEPGTPSTAARLATVTAARELGLPCSIFLMPILPYLTDTRAHLDEALRRAKEAGATSVLYTALHLRPGAREWFFEWLEREHPELVPRYRQLYGGGANTPKEYRQWLAAKIRPLMRAHGLTRGEEDPSTGSIRSSALGRTPSPGAATGLISGALPRGAAGLEPTLF